MYLKYWRLRKKPFENSFEPDFYFLSENSSDILNRLGYCISERKQLAVLTGDYGTGKTFLVQNLLKKYAKDKFFILSLSATRQLPNSSHQQFILENEYQDLSSGSTFDSIQEIKNLMLEKAREGQHGILVIDEIQLIEDEHIFDDFRLLLNTNFEYKPIATVILVGHSGFQQTLANLPQLQQRLTVNCHLRPYTDDETTSFINYRLRQTGCKENMFSDEALQKIHLIAGGLPRKINNVCDLALVLAFMRRRKPIDIEIINAINNENSMLFKQQDAQPEKKTENEVEDSETTIEDDSGNGKDNTKLHFDTLVENARSPQQEPPPDESWPRTDNFDENEHGHFRFSAMERLNTEESGSDIGMNPLEKLIKPEPVSKKVDGLKNKQNFQEQDPMNNSASSASEIADRLDHFIRDNSMQDVSGIGPGFNDLQENTMAQESAEELSVDAEPLTAQDEEVEVDLDDVFTEEIQADDKHASEVICLGEDLNWTLSSFIFPTVSEFFSTLKSSGQVQLDKLNVVIETIINIVTEGDELIVRMLNSKSSHSMEEHSVNVAGLAASVAQMLNLGSREVEEVVLSALLHDIGILKIAPEIVFKKGQLLKHELDTIKEHPYLGAELVHLLRSEKYQHFMPTLRTVILQEHEREGGVGYPLGLHGDEIHKYAKIIGLCDVFEASCFRRKERKSTLIHNTIKKIIDLDEKYFATKIKKGLVKKLTLYPLSCYVQLNSGEIGCVVKVSNAHPLRPVLEMVTDSEQNRLPKSEIRDLLKSPFLFIEKVVDEEDIL